MPNQGYISLAYYYIPVGEKYGKKKRNCFYRKKKKEKTEGKGKEKDKNSLVWEEKLK